MLWRIRNIPEYVVINAFRKDNGQKIFHLLNTLGGRRKIGEQVPPTWMKYPSIAKANGGKKIVIDFAQTSYISSAGLRVLLKTAKTLHQKSGKLALCGANEQILEVLEMSGFLTMMQHHKNLDAAVEAVA